MRQEHVQNDTKMDEFSSAVPAHTVKNNMTVKILRVTIAGNIVLAVFKAAAGILGNSSALTADAVHTFSDVFGSAALLIGGYFANLKCNKNKVHLQDKIESVISLFLSILLFGLAVKIGAESVSILISGEYKGSEMPTMLPLVAAIVSLCTKEFLRAVAWHNRADAFLTIGSLAGIVGARQGYPVFDPLACTVISILILKAAGEIFREAFQKLRCL